MAPSKGEIREEQVFYGTFRDFSATKKDRLTLRFIFVVFRCGGAKEIVGKPQKRGKANCSCRS